MKPFFLFLATLLFYPAGGSSNAPSALADGPELKLKAPRVRFLRPMTPNQRRRTRITIRITAQLNKLSEAKDLEDYYCLEEVWDWDDDTDSEYEPDCDPYEDGMDLKQRFSASHQYRYPGTYNVWLRLKRNGKTVLAGSTNVQIRN